MMDAEWMARVQKLEDRQAIVDCLVRYCRGMDRFDRDLVLSAYHPDAIDDHGIFVGGPEEFADWAMALHGSLQSVTQHILTNHTCELDGDVAHTETYFLVAWLDPDMKPLYPVGGRYIDRFERRKGRWAIAARKSIPEWGMTDGTRWERRGGPTYVNGIGVRDRTDPSYERPLTIDPARIGLVWPDYDLRPSRNQSA
jgi:hypothetical protein